MYALSKKIIWQEFNKNRSFTAFLEFTTLQAVCDGI